MADFNEEGYLSEDVLAIKRELISRNKGIFAFVKEINIYCHKIRSKLVADNSEGKEVVAACLCIKIMNGQQAAIILCEMGLTYEAEIVMRAVFEAMVILLNIVNKEGFLVEYAKSDDIDRKKLMKGVQRNNAPFFEEVKKIGIEKALKEVDERIRDEGVKERNLKELAENVGMLGLYDSVYRIASGAVHSSPRQVSEYCISDKEGRVIGFKSGPIDEGAVLKVLHTAIGLVLIALRSIDKQFKLGIIAEIEVYEKRLETYSVKDGRIV